MTVPMLHPLPGAPVTGDFGERTIQGKEDFHTGTDFGAASGTPIQAAAAGRVATVGWDPPGYGHYVDVDHGGGVLTRYAHMRDRPRLTVGDQIAARAPVGLVGSTGWSTGPHLHLEVRVKGRAVDPLPYITTEGDEDMPLSDKDVQRIAEATAETLRHHQREAGRSPDGKKGRTLFDLAQQSADGLTDKRAASIDHHLRHSFRERGFGWQDKKNGRTIWEMLQHIIKLLEELTGKPRG